MIGGKCIWIGPPTITHHHPLMERRLPLLLLTLLIPLVFSPRQASAQLTLSFANPNAVVQPGGAIIFTGTFTNTSATDTFTITSIECNNSFFTPLPGFVHLAIDSEFSDSGVFTPQFAPGDSYTGPILEVVTSSTAAQGFYPELSSIPAIEYNIHDVTTGSDINLIHGPSGMSITVVPEPSSLALLAFAAGGWSLTRRRLTASRRKGR